RHRALHSSPAWQQGLGESMRFRRSLTATKHEATSARLPVPSSLVRFSTASRAMRIQFYFRRRDVDIRPYEAGQQRQNHARAERNAKADLYPPPRFVERDHATGSLCTSALNGIAFASSSFKIVSRNRNLFRR